MLETTHGSALAGGVQHDPDDGAAIDHRAAGCDRAVEHVGHEDERVSSAIDCGEIPWAVDAEGVVQRLDDVAVAVENDEAARLRGRRGAVGGRERSDDDPSVLQDRERRREPDAARADAAHVFDVMCAKTDRPPSGVI